MKKTLLIIPFLLINIIICQSVIIKDADTNSLIEINDEGTTGSITLPFGGTPDPLTNKLYNEGGALKWNGSALSTGGNTLDQAYDQGGLGVGRTITADAGAFNVGGVDGVLFTGTFNSGTIPIEGAGTRMMWYPKKAAFRAGGAVGLQWNDVNIGLYSTATGHSTKASGDYSTAMGQTTTASGDYSVAIGSGAEAIGQYSMALGGATTASVAYSTAIGGYTEASGTGSTAMGNTTKASGGDATSMGGYTEASGTGSIAAGYYSVASGNYSTAIGHTAAGSGVSSIAIGNHVTASGNNSTAIGASNTASQWYSTAMGNQTIASGQASTALGKETTASSAGSTAMGSNTTASGDYSATLGYYTKTNSYASTAIGHYNLGGGTPSAWVATDPIFEIGNGTGPGFEHNVLTVLKIGKVGIDIPNPTHLLDVGLSGAYCNGGAWVDGSSRDFKENILELDLTEAQEALQQLNPVTFNYKTDLTEKSVGFIAEEVPELVATNERKGLSAMEIVAVLTKVTQEQQKVIKKLSERIEDLESR